MGNCTAQRGSFGTPTAEAAAVSQSNPVNGSVFVARDFRLRQAESIAAQFELIMSFTCTYHLQENDGLLDEGSDIIPGDFGLTFPLSLSARKTLAIRLILCRRTNWLQFISWKYLHVYLLVICCMNMANLTHIGPMVYFSRLCMIQSNIVESIIETLL